MRKRGPNEGSIWQRADGRWEGRISLGYRNGKRARKAFYGRTRRQVREQLTRALRDQQLGLPLATDERMTVAAFLERWLVEVAAPSVRQSTYLRYSQISRRHLIPNWGIFGLRSSALPTSKLS